MKVKVSIGLWTYSGDVTRKGVNCDSVTIERNGEKHNPDDEETAHAEWLLYEAWRRRNNKR